MKGIISFVYDEKYGYYKFYLLHHGQVRPDYNGGYNRISHMIRPTTIEEAHEIYRQKLPDFIAVPVEVFKQEVARRKEIVEREFVYPHPAPIG